MEPLLFFFFGETGYTEIKLKMTFEGLKSKNTSMSDFNDFMNSLEKIHNLIILNTQPEYQLNDKLNFVNNSAILDYHKLKIEQLCRKNPFEIVLNFQIITGGISSYWTVLNILVAICEKYGKTTNDLMTTIESFKLNFTDLHNKFRSTIPFFKGIELFENKDKLFEKISFTVKKLLTNKDFSFYYNSFCKTTITITKFISSIENSSDEETVFIDNS